MISFRALQVTLACLSLAALSCLPVHAAHAQLSVGGGHGGGGGGDDNAESAEAKANAAANAPPPALPGAVPSDPDEPSTHAALDMNPNAALFDAIDRGDLTAARDALSRGANLQATNVLGQTPIDMSVDLSRNDITFLLLSMRNTDAPQGADVATASVAAPKLGQLSVHAHDAHEKDRVQQASYSALAVHGGTPKPDVGFLGFSGT